MCILCQGALRLAFLNDTCFGFASGGVLAMGFDSQSRAGTRECVDVGDIALCLVLRSRVCVCV